MAKNEFRIGNVIFTENDIPILEMALKSLKKDATHKEEDKK